MSDNEKIVAKLQDAAAYFRSSFDAMYGTVACEKFRSWTDAIEQAIALLKAQEPRVMADTELETIRKAPLILKPNVDAAPVVRCKDCKHRIVNENAGKKGYLALEAMCALDTNDPYELGRNAEDPDWFCADGERRDEDALSGR